MRNVLGLADPAPGNGARERVHVLAGERRDLALEMARHKINVNCIAPEESVMIFPRVPWATMERAAAWQVRKTPRTLVSMTRSHSSAVISSTGVFG